MTYEVLVEGAFIARHAVRLPDGTVESSHEHNWRVTVRFVGTELDECGLLIDFGAAKLELDRVIARFDRTDLNRNPALGGLSPTTEHLAQLILEGMPEHHGGRARIQSVMVTEAAGCAAVCGHNARG